MKKSDTYDYKQRILRVSGKKQVFFFSQFTFSMYSEITVPSQIVILIWP